MLFLQGTRDRLADLTLLRPICSELSPHATLRVIDGADHSFHVLKRSGRTDADVLTIEERMVVVPDDPRLGEYREEFAGMVGTYFVYPRPADGDRPGFAGAVEILDHDAFYELVRRNKLKRRKVRKPADRLFRKMCVQDGEKPKSARRLYRLLRAFGWAATLSDDP